MTLRNPRCRTLIGLVAAAGTGWSVLVAAQAADDRAAFESPALQQLGQALLDHGPKAAEEFWTRTVGHIPLIEPIDGQPDFRWITFLWRGNADTREVSVGVGDIPTPDPRKWSFRRIGDTDVWFKTDRVPKDARFTYLLRVNGGPLQADPLNDRRFGGRSVAELPNAPPQPWIANRPEIPKGQLTAHTLYSQILREKRSIGVYTPPGYDDRGRDSRSTPDRA